MLKELKIENYAIIDSLEIDFTAGLNTITGETGAGKSILLGALELLAGARADSSVILDDKRNCVIEALFEVDSENSFFQENDISTDGNELVIRRIISSMGRSRAFINDEPVTLTLLKELSERLVDIHSQHQTLLLSRSDYQTEIIDSLTGYSLEKYRELYKQLRSTEKRLRTLSEQSEQNRQRADYLDFQINQIEEAKIIPSEIAEIEERIKLLDGATEVTETLSGVIRLMQQDEAGVVVAIKNSYQALARLKAILPKSVELSERLETLYIEAKELASDIEYIADDITVNPNEQQTIRERLDEVYSLMHKHSVDNVEELLTLRQTMQQELEAFVDIDIEVEKLTKIVSELTIKTRAESEVISKHRHQVVPDIEKQIITTLKELEIKDAQFKVLVTDIEHLTATGANTISMLFSGNAGKPPQPIESVASGGEMSRVMLAIKGLISRTVDLPTIIFDEIDAGVSGVVAHKMGEIILEMSHKMQVLNITHLPQIASRGESHLLVFKDSEGTHIRRLTKGERLDHIATMLSGSTVTEAARRQAEELLKG